MALWEISLKLPKNYAVYFETLFLNLIKRGRIGPVEYCAKRMVNT